ncbi:hypothetical protein JWR97_08900 [Pseudomonas cedrina subsp. fulgida]|nr:hypothetical protein [Pseudomonas cedrina subsp. fulgida]
MEIGDKTAAGSAITTGAAAGIANASIVYGGAIAAANAAAWPATAVAVAGYGGYRLYKWLK